MTNLDISYSKCIKVIQSITEFKQVIPVENYIKNFCKLYNIGEQNDMTGELAISLQSKIHELEDKYNEI